MAGMRFVAKRVVISRGKAGELLVTAKPHSDNGDENGNGNGNGTACTVEVYSPGDDDEVKTRSAGGAPGVGDYARISPHDDDPPYFVGCTGGDDGEGGGCTLNFKVDPKTGSVIYWCNGQDDWPDRE